MQQLHENLKYLKSNIYNLKPKGFGLPSSLHLVFLGISVFILTVGVFFQLKNQTLPIQAEARTKTVPTDSTWNTGTLSNAVITSNTVQIDSNNLSIDNADTIGNWATSDGTNSVITQDTSVKQEGTGSVKVAATANAASSNTSLDFDVADRAQFTEQDSTNGTDFTSGTVNLKSALAADGSSNSSTTDATAPVGSGGVIFYSNQYNDLGCGGGNYSARCAISNNLAYAWIMSPGASPTGWLTYDFGTAKGIN